MHTTTTSQLCQNFRGSIPTFNKEGGEKVHTMSSDELQISVYVKNRCKTVQMSTIVKTTNYYTNYGSASENSWEKYVKIISMYGSSKCYTKEKLYILKNPGWPIMAKSKLS